MAVDIRNTKHYKKGEKLPDGSTAKRGVVINTTTGKRVTGKVIMSAAGQGGMGATKTYKAGRSVSAMKAKAEKTRKSLAPASGGGTRSKPKFEEGDRKRGPNGRMNVYRNGRWQPVDQVKTASARDRAMAGRPGQTKASASSDESKRVSRRPQATKVPGKAAATSGYVRGIGGMGAAQIKTRSEQLKKQYGTKTLRGALARKSAEDRRNQVRDALGIATATIGPALLATPAGAAAVGAAARGAASAGRAAAKGADKVTRPVIGGTSKSGKSTSNKAAIAAFKAKRAAKQKIDRLSRARKNMR
jgi:hypothetical protein